MVAVILPAVWFLPPLGFAGAFGAIALLAGWEWTDLAGLERKAQRLGFCLGLLACMGTVKFWAEYLFGWFEWPVTVWWVLFGVALRQVPERLLTLKYPAAVKLLSGFFVLLSAWVLFVWLRFNFGVKQVLYLLVLIALADMAAYFVGRRWGLTKLLPQISPGKTVEGLYGALACALVLALAVGGYYYGIAGEWTGLAFADFVMLSLVTVLMSVCGDLFESLAKRLRGVKDSGSWLPGHGGVLDRIDSLLAVVPVFYAGSMLRGIFL